MKIPRALVAFTWTLALAAVSCAGSSKLQMTASPDIPAAQSKVKISSTENGNTQIELKVEHLAPPARVDPAATVYVVWARGNDDGAQPVNLGALRVDDDLNGSITAVTPLRAFDLYVTAESSQAVTTPTGKTLLSTTVTMRK